MNRIFFLFSLVVLSTFISCRRFDPPISELRSIPAEDSLFTHFYVIITDGGGYDIFNEKGYCYAFHENPNVLDIKNSTIVPLTSPYKDWFFDWEMNFPTPDTTYYLRAYVKNNAGIGYSNMLTIDTRTTIDTIPLPPIDTIPPDTVKFIY